MLQQKLDTFGWFLLGRSVENRAGHHGAADSSVLAQKIQIVNKQLTKTKQTTEIVNKQLSKSKQTAVQNVNKQLSKV